MEHLLPITLIFNFILLATSAILLIYCIKRSTRINQLENLLNEAGGVAASSKRSVESMQKTHQSERERLQTLRSDMEVLRAELEACKQSAVEKDQHIEEINAGLAALEPARKRADEAEHKVLALQKEAAVLRSECAQSHKRVETAESAARDKQIQFERIEASLEAKDRALFAKQQESADQARELSDRRSEISDLIVERDQLKSMEAALATKLKDADESLKEGERARQRLNDELADRKLELSETQEKLTRMQQMADEQAAIGGSEAEQRRKLQDELLEVEAKLARKEAALVDLERAHADAEREEPYQAHRHMQWTLNHFDPKAITFKFTNEGAKVHLVAVDTNVPQLRYEFETGRDLPRGDFEARIKLAIKKAEQKNMEQLPDEFDMTVLYALNVFPIHFKIRPREGQRIERIQAS